MAAKSNYEALVVHCRGKYLEFKDDVEGRRKREAQDLEEFHKESESMSMFSSSSKNKGGEGVRRDDEKKKKQATLEGYKQEVFDNS